MALWFERFNFGGSTHLGEDHLAALRELFLHLKNSKALELQEVTWKTHSQKVDVTPLRPPAHVWAGAEHFVRALYRCGCFVDWQDLHGRGRGLPEPCSDGDEHAYAKAHLGPWYKEHACSIHGKYNYSVKDEAPWWNPKRCRNNGGHRIEGGGCKRCGAPEGFAE